MVGRAEAELLPEDINDCKNPGPETSNHPWIPDSRRDSVDR